MSKEKVGPFKLGAVLGKGGFGTVYSGLDEDQGGFYAIKQVNLAKIPKDQLSGIMQEIDLLKNLNHTNIVKYIKYIKTKDHLYIVLELVENGSLSSIVKKFGKLPEPLVCVYITQVLEGLVYLHEQGVVHRDIKGANILTTKEGIIKLADFGVATKFGDENAAAVVGTPYWMAPEIIELNGSTTASDLWSVGCTVIELLTGAPPYYDLGPMPALFRIVQDDYPPLPEGISPALKDWLMQCFQKDPVLRISATKLLKHKWIKSGNKRKPAEEPDERLITKYNEKANLMEQKKLPKVVEPVAPPPKQVVLPPPEEDDTEDWESDFNSPVPLQPLTKKDNPPAKSQPPIKPAAKPIPKSPLANPQKASNNDIKKKPVKQEEPDEVWDDDFASPGPAASLKGLLGPATDDMWGDEEDTNADKKKLSDTKKEKSVRFNKEPASKPVVGGKFVEKDDGESGFGDMGGQIANFFAKNKITATGKDSLQNGSWNLAKRLKPLTPGSQLDLDPFDKDDDEDEDGFFDFDELPVVQTKDVWGKMNEEILKLISKLQLNQNEDVILSAAQELTTIFRDNPEHKVHLIRNIGVIPIMEMLEGSNPRVLQSILQVVNQIIENNIEIKENLCLVGGIPAIMKFAVRDYALPIRLECANFVSQMCSTSTVTLQFFIACRGLPTLVDILSTPYAESKKLVWTAVDAICSVFELQSTTPKNDFCRLFSKCGLLPVLGGVLRQSSEDPEANQYPAKIANLFLIFSSADAVVKLAMSQPEVLATLFDPIDHDRLRAEVLVKVLKAVKQLSMDHSTLANLQRAGTIRRLVRVLARHDGSSVTEMHNHALNALYNLCKLDQDRQFTAAQDGVVPHLMHIIESQSPLRQFALPVLCDIAHVKRARAELWKHRTVEFYLGLLEDQYWQVNALDSLSVWLIDETEKVEKIIATPAQIAKVVHAFGMADVTAFANLMEPMLHMVTTSLRINVGLGTSPLFVPKLLERLKLHPKAEVRVNLLRILTSLYKCHPNPKKMIGQFDLYPTVQVLTDDKIVLVQKLASQLIIAFNTNTVL